MNSFVTSLALVLIAQVPLLLKLWLDYRSKTSGFKQELYQRQIDAFQILLTTLTELHENLQLIVETFPDVTIFEGDTEETAVSFYKSALTSNVDFHETSRRSSLLLPSTLLVTIHEYTGDATRIIESAWNLPTSRTRIRPDVDLLWDKQQARFNQAMNMMRLSIGVDALSQNVYRELHPRGKVTFVSRSVRTDDCDDSDATASRVSRKGA